jgi:hypothetical protein
MEIVEQQTTLTLEAIEREAKSKYELAQHLAATAKDAARDAVLAMADCGQMLLMGREHVRGPKGEWIVGLGIPLPDAEKAVSSSPATVSSWSSICGPLMSPRWARSSSGCCRPQARPIERRMIQSAARVRRIIG